MNEFEQLKIKCIGDALEILGKNLTDTVRNNHPYLLGLVEQYKANRYKDGGGKSIYRYISEALAYRGIYQKDGEKITCEQLTTIFARLRKETHNNKRRTK
jgi:hypothetical protein